MTLRASESRDEVSVVLLVEEACGTLVCAAVVVRDVCARDTVLAVPRELACDVVPVLDAADGITRDIVVEVPSAKANGALNAIKKKHSGNLLILLCNYNTTTQNKKDENNYFKK